jgi:hypothetical protein
VPYLNLCYSGFIDICIGLRKANAHPGSSVEMAAEEVSWRGIRVFIEKSPLGSLAPKYVTLLK